jgi:hypothetical protein
MSRNVAFCRTFGQKIQPSARSSSQAPPIARLFSVTELSITYQWTSIGPLPVNIRNPSAGKAAVEFLGGYGRYEFQLTVTDDKGLMGMDSTVVFWVDP